MSLSSIIINMYKIYKSNLSKKVKNKRQNKRQKKGEKNGELQDIWRYT